MPTFTILRCHCVVFLLVVWAKLSVGQALAQSADLSSAYRGVLDLSTYSYQTSKPVSLNGQWLFQWHQLADSATIFSSQTYHQVPGNWRAYTESHALFPQEQGFATYGLRIILPDSGRIWSLRIPPIRTAYKLYVSEQLVAQVGEVASNASMKPGAEVKVVSFLVPGKEAFLRLQVSNYHHAVGGIYKELQLGNPTAITQVREKRLLASSLIIGALLIIGLYHFVLYALRRNDRAPLFFAVLCLTAGFREHFNSESLFFVVFPEVPWEPTLKAFYAAFPISIISMILYLQSLFPSLVSPLIKKVVIFINLAFLALILLSPATVYAAWGTLISPLAILECGYFLWVSIQAARFRKEGSFILFCDMILLALCVVNDTLHQFGIIHTYFLLSSAVVIFTLCQSLLLALRFSTAFARTEALTVQLKTANRNLEYMALKRQEAEQRKTLEEIRNRFFANITHEFRTPLTLIITPVEQLLRTFSNGSAAANPGVPATLNVIHRNARQLLRLINQLLDLSKLESGSLEVKESQGNVALFTEELVSSFRLNAEAKAVSLVFQSENVPEELLFDADKWEKIIYNLLSNALKYTEAGGSVTVGLTVLSASDDTRRLLRLTVSDTGVGIPPDLLPHIFDRFYQVDDSRTRSFEGTGIGLALVKELTDLLQGHITVESQVGQGTTLIIDYPVRTPNADHPLLPSPPLVQANFPVDPAPENGTEPQPITGQNRALILVVEDNDDLRHLIATSLSGPYSILTAANGQEGWELCRTELPDLVLSDVMMPRLDGYQLCYAIKHTPETNHIAVILLTAKTATASRLEGLTAGANDYLTKPFDQQELRLRVGNLLHHQQLLRSFYARTLTQSGNIPVVQADNGFLNQLYQTLEKEIDNTNFSVDDLSSAVCMSSRTLNRKLSTLLGMTGNEFIRNYRLRKATDLLKAGHPVLETAYLVGFDSPSYFGYCFKELFSLSPSEYVRSILSES
ncbi:ATP-binding protein [Larkinella sp. VNQ87]|uniref:hybrid sensor histidine kinase/response regulator transcription factor n=1 Tax=Larkinella sp. VNQ87 TaxID=3400921 RepID=UPI003BFCD7B4